VVETWFSPKSEVLTSTVAARNIFKPVIQPAALKAEAGQSQLLGQPGQLREILAAKKKKKKREEEALSDVTFPEC
jgi:hypothetical protein